MRSLHRHLATVAAAVVASSVLTATAAALPGTRTTDEGLGAFAKPGSGRDSGGHDLARGLYVLGDSISGSPGQPAFTNGTWWAGSGPLTPSYGRDTSGGSQAPPYEILAALSLKHQQSAVRSVSGFTIQDHLTQRGYPSNPNTTSVEDVRASKAGAVFVELGTNDVSCLYRSAQVPRDQFGDLDRNSPVCDGNLPVPTTTDERDKVKQKIASQAYTLVAQLTQGDPTRCVMLSGLREVNIYGAKAEDYRWFNGVLRYLAAGNPHVKFANLDLYWRSQQSSNGPLWADWGKRWPGLLGDTAPRYDVHLHTSEGANSLARFAVYAAAVSKTTKNDLFPYGGCGIDE